MTCTVLELHRLPNAERQNLKAFAAVQAGPWTVRGVRLIQQPGQRAYCALPQSQGADGRYWPVLQTSDSNIKDAISAAVLSKWAETYDETNLL